jgi:hypothetical protein
MHFRPHAYKGFQKFARIKLLVNNMLGEKTMSIIQTNFIVIAVKDKKCLNDENDRRHCGFRRRCCIVRPAAKPLMQFSSGRLCLRPSRFSSQKIPYRRSRAGFCGRMKKWTLLAPHSRTSNGGKGVKTIR